MDVYQYSHSKNHVPGIWVSVRVGSKWVRDRVSLSRRDELQKSVQANGLSFRAVHGNKRPDLDWHLELTRGG